MHISKGLEEEGQKTQNNNKDHLYLPTARKADRNFFQLLIPSWSKTPSTVRFTGDNAHKTYWSRLCLLYMCIYLRWKNGEDG
jgi:hypothetical protein